MSDAAVLPEQKTVRTDVTGDKIFLIKDGKRQWIRNPETLHALGFEFGQEVKITPQELYNYEDGGSIDLKENKETGETEIEYTAAYKPGGSLNYRRSA